MRLLLSIACGLAITSCASPADRVESVILISIDTLRADALSSYGNSRPTSPNLDQLAREGIRFSTAIAPSPWTVPSHATLLTSLDPTVIGANGQRPVPADATTIAEILGSHDYATPLVPGQPQGGSGG